MPKVWCWGVWPRSSPTGSGASTSPVATPHMDCGDHVIVVNGKGSAKGNKRTAKTYYWHTGYPGGIKSRTADKILDGKHPERVIIKAVERMIPRGPLGRRRMKHLHVYAGASHPHGAAACHA